MDTPALDDDAYRELHDRRRELRNFLRWSEHQAQEVGLTDAHHQLLIAIRAHPDPLGPTIGDIATDLVLRHHSAVELVQRAEAAGFVTRAEDPEDRRRVRLGLSPAGESALLRLAAVHEEELRVLSGDPHRFSGEFAAAGSDLADGAPDLVATADVGVPPRGAGHAADPHPAAAPPPAPAPVAQRPVAALRVCNVYDHPGPEVGRRVLVDRLWPRGIRADDAPFEEWLSVVAPSNELRRLLAGDAERFDEFADRYRRELTERHEEVLVRLEDFAIERPLTLVTATDELATSAAAVLAKELADRIGRRINR